VNHIVKLKVLGAETWSVFTIVVHTMD